MSVPERLAHRWAGTPEAAVDTEQLRAALDEVRTRAAYTAAPTSARLPISYQRIPAVVRSLAAGILGRVMRRRQARWARFPDFPLDLSADFLADLAGMRSPFASGPAPVILSHDLDSPEGLQNLVERFLALEEDAGARSTSFVVPCAWPLDHGLLEETARRGHELGIHGYDHSNRTPFLSEEQRQQRVAAAEPLIRRYGMHGYRAPSLCRSPGLLQALPRHFRYDSSIPTAGGPFPVPNNGNATARPYWIGPIAELPLSLPRDGSLRFLGYRPREIVEIWKQTALRIARSGGVVVLLTHCEARFSGGPAMLGAYREFLEFVASSPQFAFSSPRKVLREALGLEWKSVFFSER